MKFTDKVKAFFGDLFDGIACRFSTAVKFVRRHYISFCIGAAAVVVFAVLLAVFVPRIADAIERNRVAKAEAQATEHSVEVPTTVPTPTPTATPTPEPTPEPTPTPVPLQIKKGDRNDIVIDIQLRLMELNYMDYDEPTNYFGTITSEAVRQFQRRNGLPITGEITQTDFSLLMSGSAKIYMASKGDEGTDITEMQKRLYELDYLKNITGVFDDETEAAILLFQEKNELEVDGMVGSQTKECLYSEDPVPFSLYVGSEGEDVLMYQERLVELGYLATKPNGIYGSITLKAVKRFQERNAIIVDGHIGPATREALMSANAKYNKIELTMSGHDVIMVQERLYKLNYMTRSEVTGYFGAKTEAAVMAFQRANGIEADGIVGKHTLEMLNSEDAVRADRPTSSTPTPSPTPKPTPKPTKTPKPTAVPTATPTPKPKPTRTPRPTATPRPGTTAAPTPKPTKTPKPTAVPTATPTPTPKPTRTPKPTATATPKPTAVPGPTTEDRINRFVRIAKSKLGCPYVRGAKGPNSFDCSGFVYWCLNQAGVQQSYMTSYQWRFTTRYQRINSMSNIRKGDVIVFKMGTYSGHVAIAAGDGMMVDASSNEGQIVFRTYESTYWRTVFYCAYRIFTD
ncbi:MAG: peptidoglycan-binding protein [Clostridiales bacterium]|nr:peptidoglycan-binding protein [Clostridiales bacterium]